MHTGTESYYRERALEYDRVYAKPERQADLRELEAWLPTRLADRAVLEVATGTGYWTQLFADHAASVVGTDINEAVLDVARGRRAWPDTVRFEIANGFELDQVAGTFDTCVAGFFWSHLLLNQTEPFLRHVAERLGSGCTLILLDNRYVEGSNHPVTKTDDDGNTYQRRRLDDGTEWDVLKNFPTPAELTASLQTVATEVHIRELDYYWIAEATLS